MQLLLPVDELEANGIEQQQSRKTARHARQRPQ
jgi:hypothetical protein